VKYIQLDASINNGNSGGPLINPETLEVIGIVTRKATGLTRQFDKLIDSFNHNIRVLEASNANVFMKGINPIEELLDSQRKMLELSSELKRSTNVGIGYAFEISKIRSSLQKLQ
jgi:hypothetical protein